MKQITVANGRHIALVDDEDFERLSAFTWRVRTYTRKDGSKTMYAWRRITKPGMVSHQPRSRTGIYMHRMILACTELIDHRDGNGLNNQRNNLRIADCSMNGANRFKVQIRQGKPTLSRFKGVAWQARRGKWNASIRKDGKTIWIGRFKEEWDAAQAYNFKAEELFGEFARFNIA